MRTKKAFLNMATSMLYQVVATICGLITPRLILSAFGSTYNGVINSVTQFIGMISILTLGITGATRLALYKPLADKDTIKISKIMRATEIYMRKVALGLLLYVGILCVIYPFISHNDLTPSQCRIIVAIVSIGTFAEYCFGITNQALLTADQSSYVIQFFHIAKTFLNTVLVIVLIRLGASIFVVKLGSSIIYFIIPVYFNFYVRKKYGIIKKIEPDKSAIQQRGAIAIHAIANLVHNNTDIALLTLFSDAKIISVYTVYYLVIGKIKTLMQVITKGMEAAFGSMWIKKEYETLHTSFSAYEFLLYSFTVVMFSCVGLLIVPFIRIYTIKVTDIEYVNVPLAILIAVTEGFYCIRQPYVTLVYATGFYEETKVGAIIEAALNIIISLVLINIIGLPGVVIGTLVAHVFRTIQFAIFVSKTILKRSILIAVKRLIWTLCSIGMIVAIKQFLIDAFITFQVGWKYWFINSIITFTISTVITVFSSYLFYKNDLLYICRKLFRAIKRK